MFNLVIAKNELLSKVLMVAGAVDKRQSLPILSNILLAIKDNRLSITATDLEIEISACMDCISSVSEGAITVPAKKFIDILRSLEDGSVPQFSCEGDIFTIKSGRSRFKLATRAADEFPKSDNETAEFSCELPTAELLQLLQMTHFAMSQQDVRVFLNGLLLEFDGSSIRAVATDAHRMAIYKKDLQTKFPFYRILLPRKSILEILRVLQTITDENIKIFVANNYFQIQTHDFCFTTKLIEARFPPYAKAIPHDNDKLVTIDKETLKRALARILILAHEKSRAVSLNLEPASLTLIANNQDNEEAMESMEAQVEGEALSIGINAGYLLDVLHCISDPFVKLCMSTRDRSILVVPRDESYYQYVIMPMKL